MINQAQDIIQQHIRTHTERSVDDRSAVSLLENFLRSDGKINTNFSADDKWPNHDGTFEFVPNPDVSRKPKQNFYVQIKGTHDYVEKDGVVKYSLQSLAFPAFICENVTLDPGILFVVLKPRDRGEERVFWKYMSVSFLNSINFLQKSVTINFESDDEIYDTEESVDSFCEKLEIIVDRHRFVNRLSQASYTREQVEQIIYRRSRDICEAIDRISEHGDSRDNVSERMLSLLDDLCSATLLLNAINEGFEHASLPLAWERSLLNINTKYLGIFLKGLRYIGKRIPDQGQSERLMLKYYDYLWRIRKLLNERYGINVLDNLEKFPLYQDDDIDREYHEIVAAAIDSVKCMPVNLHQSRYYIQKKIPFFIGKERYYEVTLQLAGLYASKYNRITAYTKEDISSNYTIQIDYVEMPIKLWEINTYIKIITGWTVSIAPVCLNKLASILKIPTHLSSTYGEYHNLMDFLRRTGMSILDLIDLQEVDFNELINSIYDNSNTSIYKNILIKLRERYSRGQYRDGYNVIRYLLIDLREETLVGVMPNKYKSKTLCADLNLSSSCRPFENNPFVSNLAGSRTNVSSQLHRILNVTGLSQLELMRPYLEIRDGIDNTGEIFFPILSDSIQTKIQDYNDCLNRWEQKQGYGITIENGYMSIDSYVESTVVILQKLIELSRKENRGQREYNRKFLTQNPMDNVDELKKIAIQEAFVRSRVLLIYGAAGTGKTTLMNYISNLMKDRRKLFLTKTHTALQNLKRRIDNPGATSDFISIDSFTKRVELQGYDVIFIDECSTIDNRTMQTFLNKVRSDTFLVLAGDIHQIESIDFGNWFFYAKNIIKTKGANVELLSTWRTQNIELQSLWKEVRVRGPYITEKLVIDGPFSENIGSNILDSKAADEVILCLNYDGKFGLNNMNNYFQAANASLKEASWADWTYKVGDPILFNDSKRFTLLYNNLKGRIVDIEKEPDVITFTIDVERILTDVECQKDGIVLIEVNEHGSRIQFSVSAYEDVEDDGIVDEEQRMRSIIPFQLAYAVSIHKAQGLEYDSVKLIIPGGNAEKITHGVFYTAITRAKKYLKIYWSSESMHEIVRDFTKNKTDTISLKMIKTKLLNENP